METDKRKIHINTEDELIKHFGKPRTDKGLSEDIIKALANEKPSLFLKRV